MKRLKYKLIKYLKLQNEEGKIYEINKQALKFLLLNKKFNSNSHKFALKIFLEKNSLHPSKIKNYCLVTGRTGYTISKIYTSRHIFFKYISEEKITGFLYSSAT